MGVMVPEKYGGSGLDMIIPTAIIELGKADASVAITMATQPLGIMPLLFGKKNKKLSTSASMEKLRSFRSY